MSGDKVQCWTRTVAIAALGLALGACDGLGLGGEPERLRLEIDAATPTDIVLVTSTQFRYEIDPACDQEGDQPCQEVLRVLSADTSMVTPPTSQILPFTQTLRYFVEVFPATVSTTVSLRAFVDGDPWANESRELAIPATPDEERETIQFVYQYAEPRIN